MRETVKIFLDELPWDLRSRNTDWRYVRFTLPLLARFEPSLEFFTQTSRGVTLRGNLKTIRGAAGRRMGLAPSEYQMVTSRLDAKELRATGAEIVFAHRAFPLNAGSVPVVWQSSILDPAMQRSYGATESVLAEEIAVKRPLYAQCAAVTVSSDGEARRMSAMFPELAERFVAVPFFMPNAKPCEEFAVRRQLDTDLVRILFVGNHAWRKGLDVLLEAFLRLPASVLARAELTVVSSFDRSKIKLPQHARIRYVRGMAAADVQTEMARSHVLVNVARFESYGLVFLEAMAQGMVCLGPDWEVQRELLGGGAGLNLPLHTDAMAEALTQVIEDAELRYRIGMTAWQRFAEKYAPGIVARKFADVFQQVSKSADC